MHAREYVLGEVHPKKYVLGEARPRVYVLGEAHPREYVCPWKAAGFECKRSPNSKRHTSMWLLAGDVWFQPGSSPPKHVRDGGWNIILLFWKVMGVVLPFFSLSSLFLLSFFSLSFLSLSLSLFFLFLSLFYIFETAYLLMEPWGSGSLLWRLWIFRVCAVVLPFRYGCSRERLRSFFLKNRLPVFV